MSPEGYMALAACLGVVGTIGALVYKLGGFTTRVEMALQTHGGRLERLEKVTGLDGGGAPNGAPRAATVP